MTASAQMQEHDRVVLTIDVPENNLVSGDIGAVISVLKDGEAYTVEFMTLSGSTFAVTSLLASHVRPVASNEVSHARPLAID